VQEALETDPAAQDFFRTVVLPEHLQTRILDDVEPVTWPNPWDSPFGIEQSLPTWPVWMDDCYAGGAGIDTDGDGWPDWIECRLGTDPFNPGTRPNPSADPDRDGHTNEQECIEVMDLFDLNDLLVAVTPDVGVGQAPTAEDIRFLEEVLNRIAEDLREALGDVATEPRQIE
jgi:hypothetical protein